MRASPIQLHLPLTATPAAHDPTATVTGTRADAGPQRGRGRQVGETPPAAANGNRARSRSSGPPLQARAEASVRSFPRAEHPAPVPTPEHHHLPGWVRRAHAQARPALGDLLALLQGEERAQLQRRLDELTAAISAGRFSLAWQYPGVISDGRALLERQRAAQAETERANRALETRRRRASERVREVAEQLPAEAAARLGRALRSASDDAAIAAVEAEADGALSSARSGSARRRDREIERTRSQLRRALPKSAAAEPEATESWQDVLRRFAAGQGEAVEA